MLLSLMFSSLDTIFSYPNVLYVVIGTLYGLFIGFLPGAGGTFALVTLLPFVFNMDPSLAIILLLSAHAVDPTGGSISSILFGVPGGPVNAATVLDGYPLAKKGQAGRALGAALFSSALGGIFGAIVLAASIPVLRPLVLTFGPPETLMLALLGISLITTVASKDQWKGILCGLLGILLSLVGQDWVTGAMRYTFGFMYLWDGLKLLPVLLGLFAVAEMVELAVEGGSIREESAVEVSDSPWTGVVDTLRHWWLVLRCSAIGTIVGFIPGLGGDVANFLAYGHAAQTSKKPEEFGSGVIEGVLAPEAANNAKEGGALIPTLAFGIPGSSGMAVLLGALTIVGVTPGPEMFSKNLNVVAMMITILIVSNILGAAVFFPFMKHLARLTTIKASLMAPVILVVAMIGSYYSNRSMGDLIVTLIFGLVGYEMKKFNFSRPSLVLGFILGIIVERNMWLSFNSFGWGMLQRPVTLIAFVCMVLIIGLQIAKTFRARKGMTAA